MMTSLDSGRQINVLCCLSIFIISIQHFAQVYSNPPIFNSEYDKEVLFLPKDIRNGTAIYRFAASDNENQVPLMFTVKSSSAPGIVDMVNVSNTEADLVLKRSLPQVGAIYEIYITVTDQAGESTPRRFRINVTDARGTPDQVFIDYQSTYTVSEKENSDAIIGQVIARSDEHMHQHVNLTIKGSSLFTINPVLRDGNRIVEGQIKLHGQLDYEKEKFYWIQIEALNGYIEKPVDTRNIIYLPVMIIVKDEQDTPPIFANDFPTVVIVPNDMEAGGKVTKVSAEDGDTDNKRSIRYSLVPGVDWQYFQIDPESGEIMLTKSVEEMTHENNGAPIILSIKAEEMQSSPLDESASTIKEMVILLGSRQSVAPTFMEDSYEGEIEEHSPPLTVVTIKGNTKVTDSDVGIAGIFTLSLQDVTPGLNIDHILEVTPSVMINEGNFQIRVKNPYLLDYEKFKELKFKIVAKELSQSGLESSAEITVHLQDINDNYPVFTQDVYEVHIAEDAKEGMFIAQVTATDADSDQFGTITYTKITGDVADKLHLDPKTGRITVSKSTVGIFDRENQPEHVLKIEASDLGNPPKVNVTTLKIIVDDVNDNAPQFKKGVYEVVVDPDIPRTEPFLQVEAVDADEPGNSNSVVRYEILRGNRGDMFQINSQTGDLSLRKSPAELRSSIKNALSDTDEIDEPSTYTLTVRAYDMGIPHLNSTVIVYVHFKTDIRTSMNVTIQYIFPQSVTEINRDKDRVERFLSKLNGASTTIERVAPYGQDDPYQEIMPRSTLNDRSLVTTNVRYHKKSLVDLSFIARNGTTALLTDEDSIDVAEAGVSYSWKAALITLLIILAIILLLLMCFCCWRQFRKLDDRKVHPADEKLIMEKSNNSQVIEVVTSDQMGLANGRHQGDKERLIAASQNGNAVFDVDGDARTAGNWRGSAGPSINRGLPNRRPQVNYSRHLLHGTDDGRPLGPATAGNSVSVELHDFERGMKQVDTKEDELLDGPEIMERGPPAGDYYKTGQRVRYRLGTQYEEVEDELEEIVVIDGDGGPVVGPPLRRIRRIIKRPPSRSQKPDLKDDEYEDEWEPSSLPDWIGRIPMTEYDGDDIQRRNLINRGGGGGSDAFDQGGRRMIVRKYRGGAVGVGGSLPGDSIDGQWVNGGLNRQVRQRRTNDTERVLFRASQRPRLRARHKHDRGRSLTRASLRIEDDSEMDDEIGEQDLIDFEMNPISRRNRVEFEEPDKSRERILRFENDNLRMSRNDLEEDDQSVKADSKISEVASTQSRGVSARPLEELNQNSLKIEQSKKSETKDSSTSPNAPLPLLSDLGSESSPTGQDSFLQSEEKSEESPDNISKKDSSTEAVINNRRSRAKRESRYMDWYKNMDRGVNKQSQQHCDPGGRIKRRRKLSPSDGKPFDENIADETTTTTVRRLRRRGSDPSVDHDDDIRRRRRRSTEPLSTRGLGGLHDAKRSDTGLDILEAQMRLGGDHDVDEEDSGIGHANDSFRSSRKQFMEKKSLFTIAYNQNKQEALKDRDSSANNTENRIT